METKTKIVAENYGEMMAQINDMDLVFYKEFGSYQGEYLVILTDGERLFYYQDYYGSCSGCDWLEAEKDLGTDNVDYKKALEFCGGIKPKYIVPKENPLIIEENEEKYPYFRLLPFKPTN